MPIDDLSLMRLRVSTDFTFDVHGRMLCSNEPREDARQPAPRLSLSRTRGGTVVRYGATMPESLVKDLARIVEHDLVHGELRLSLATAAAVRTILERQAPITAVISGPCYRFRDSIKHPPGVVRLTSDILALVRDTYPWLYDELADWEPCFAAVANDQAVSVCFSSRLGPAVAEAGVNTLPAFRRRGHAVAVTVAWGAAVRASGRISLYSTAWTNVASQGVARRLRLVMFGADTTWK
jgi:hypothetical protein